MIAVDYTSRIPPALLAAYGVSDVSRYLCYSPIGDWKKIHQPEYDELMNGGFGVTLNWELDARDWVNANGAAHGFEAVKEARNLGYPTGCTIIGSADFDMTLDQWKSSGRKYAHDFATTLISSRYRPGVYGPFDVLTWVRDAGYMDVFWQAGMSTSWSQRRNAELWPGAQIRQRHHLNINGHDTDMSDILVPNWGQARRSASPMAVDPILDRLQWFADALENGHDVVAGGPIAGRDVWLVKTVRELQGEVQRLATATPTPVTVTLDAASDTFADAVAERLSAKFVAAMQKLGVTIA